MIVDFHTHVFPPAVIDARESYVESDALFGALYSEPKAALAGAEDLLRSMDAAGVDVAVALGFAWSDAATCRLHNDYLLESAAAAGGRILPFCTLPLAAGAGAIEAEARRCHAEGARGFGELRPDNSGFDIAGEQGACLGRLAAELDTALLFHVSEPVGHGYAGKAGLTLGAFYEFVRANPDVRVIGAHWGGGLPFFALMPEVRQALTNVRFDTAATSLLYDSTIYARVAELTGAGSILFGSDYPLLSQARSLKRIREAGLDAETTASITGGNAARLLGLA